MFAQLPRRGTHPRTAAPRAGDRLRRIAAVLAAIICGLLASAGAIPAAFASANMPVPGPGGQYGPVHAALVPAAPVHMVTAGGLAGWQVTLIALGAALVAATLTALLARARAAHRPIPMPAA
ncbi:MAG: hypothetical protein ACRDNT_10630 [Streptosporangiaceae bacterium]